MVTAQLERLFSEQHRQLFVAALAITRNRAAAEDAVHDALIAVAEIRKQPENLKAYLFTTVRNKAMHQYRQLDRLSPLDEDYLSADKPNDELDIFAEQVKKHIHDLGINEQQTLILKLFEGLTFNEIAEIMGSPLNTVTSWYRRGLDKLKELLDES